MRILVFGDSIGYGSWDTYGGWAERIKHRAHQTTIDTKGQTKVQVINLSIGGETSTGILKRLEQEIAARTSPSWDFCFIFAYGTNDERMINGSIETSLELFSDNTSKIIEIAKAHTDKILYVGPPPLLDNELLFNGQNYSDTRISQYDQRLKTITEKAEISYVSTRTLFEKADKNALFCFDGLHPNNNGHALIEKIVTPRLESMINITFSSHEA